MSNEHSKRISANENQFLYDEIGVTRETSRKNNGKYTVSERLKRFPTAMCFIAKDFNTLAEATSAYLLFDEFANLYLDQQHVDEIRETGMLSGQEIKFVYERLNLARRIFNDMGLQDTPTSSRTYLEEFSNNPLFREFINLWTSFKNSVSVKNREPDPKRIRLANGSTETPFEHVTRTWNIGDKVTRAEELNLTDLPTDLRKAVGDQRCKVWPKEYEEKRWNERIAVEADTNDVMRLFKKNRRKEDKMHADRHHDHQRREQCNVLLALTNSFLKFPRSQQLNRRSQGGS